MTFGGAFDDCDATLPGAIVGVCSDGVLLHWESFGSVGGAATDPLVPTSPFYVASIAKQFTAAAIAEAVLMGLLSIDDSVRRYLPQLPVEWEAVRLRHLIEHTGGLADSNAIDRAAGWTVASPHTTQERIDIVGQTCPADPPGAVHRYSNHGYVLLAGVVEQVSGEPFGDFARRVLLTPAGMTNSWFMDVETLRPIQGWNATGGSVELSTQCCGDGGLVSTLADLARWDAWLPSSPLADLMVSNRPTLPSGRIAHDAWGISIRSHHGLRIESHGGAVEGYLASFVRFPSLNVSIIGLANTDRFGEAGWSKRMQQVVRSVVGDSLDDRLPPWTETHGDAIEPC